MLLKESKVVEGQRENLLLLYNLGLFLIVRNGNNSK